MQLPASLIVKPSRTAFLIVGLCLFLSSQAQIREEKSSYRLLGAGLAYVYDDYLSPLAYEGSSALFSKGWSTPLGWGLADEQDNNFDQAKWFSQLDFTLNPVYAKSSTGSGIFHGIIDLRTSLLHKLVKTSKYSLSAGAYGALGGGGRYNAQSSNNPGSVDAYFNLGAAAQGTFRFLLLGKNLRLTYLGNLALAGIAFSPEFAESYYEVFYLGNREHILRFTSPFNYNQWRQQLLLDVPFKGKKSSLRLGLDNNGRISRLNNIRTNVRSSHFTLGFIRYFNTL